MNCNDSLLSFVRVRLRGLLFIDQLVELVHVLTMVFVRRTGNKQAWSADEPQLDSTLKDVSRNNNEPSGRCVQNQLYTTVGPFTFC